MTFRQSLAVAAVISTLALAACFDSDNNTAPATNAAPASNATPPVAHRVGDSDNQH